MNKARIDRQIFRLTIPNILSNVSVPLLSSVDTALMGTLTPIHIGAVGIGAMIFNFLYWNLGFLRMGTTGFTAQAYGREDRIEIPAILFRALLLALALSLLLLLGRGLLGQAVFRIMDIRPSTLPIVQSYFDIRMWAAPATLGLYVLIGWYFGMQNSLIPLVLTLVSNSVNIGLSYYFVLHLGMQAEGVAWGTVIAQYVTFVVGIVYLIRYKDILRVLNRERIQYFYPFLQFLKVNRDIFIRTLVLTMVFAWLYRYSSGQGTTFLAITVILLQFLNWMSYALDGFAYAAESLTGKLYGAGEDGVTHQVIRRIFFWAGGMALGFALLYGVGFYPIARLFTREVTLLEALEPYRYWVVGFPLIGFASYIWDGVFIGLTASRSMRDSMLFSGIVFFALFYALVPIWPEYALWGALMGFLAARALFQAWIFRRRGLGMK